MTTVSVNYSIATSGQRSRRRLLAGYSAHPSAVVSTSEKVLPPGAHVIMSVAGFFALNSAGPVNVILTNAAAQTMLFTAASGLLTMNGFVGTVRVDNPQDALYSTKITIIFN